MHKEALGRGTHLTAVGIGGEHRSLGCSRHVGRRHHQERIVAAGLDQRALEGFCAGLGHGLAATDGAGKRDAVDTIVPFTIVALLVTGLCIYMLHQRLAEPLREVSIARRPPNPLHFVPRFWRQPRLRLAWILALGRSAWWTMFFIYAPIYCIESGLG